MPRVATAHHTTEAVAAYKARLILILLRPFLLIREEHHCEYVGFVHNVIIQEKVKKPEENTKENREEN